MELAGTIRSDRYAIRAFTARSSDGPDKSFDSGGRRGDDVFGGYGAEEHDDFYVVGGFGLLSRCCSHCLTSASTTEQIWRQVLGSLMVAVVVLGCA